MHRIVIGYDVNLTRTNDGLAYALTLPEQCGKCKVELQVTDLPGAIAEVTSDSKVKRKQTHDGTRFRVNKAKAGDTIRVTLTETGNVLLRSHGENEGDFFATQVELNLPADKATANSRAVFMIDTSLSSRPDKFNVWLDLLRKNPGQQSRLAGRVRCPVLQRRESLLEN